MANSTWEQVKQDLTPKVSPAKVLLGQLEQDTNFAPAFFVIAPTLDAYVAAPIKPDTGKALCFWREGCRLWCVAKTRSDTEILRNAAMANLVILYPGLVRFAGGEWGEPAWLHNGFAYGLDLTIDTVVSRVAETLADVLTVPFDTAGAVAGDGILQAGEG